MADHTIHPEHIITNEINAQAPSKTAGIPHGMRLDDIEKIAILKTLKSNDGNRTDTANQLGISIKTLYNKLDKYDNSPLV
ncbi:helix-turn-helix domain-containing protein [Marinomonas pontica]|uniref:helix-turn-helix domain-containing protein n=1 Tax=Marinomonas pontica TaxID=264739 RepID=UPI00224453B5|nr:helix-turn-helix domain-containing protein [Marinomonas pontica]MCW8356186.1 helix-turn-helix domain-containing protein [Marinomonas pontica]